MSEEEKADAGTIVVGKEEDVDVPPPRIVPQDVAPIASEYSLKYYRSPGDGFRDKWPGIVSPGGGVKLVPPTKDKIPCVSCQAALLKGQDYCRWHMAVEHGGNLVEMPSDRNTESD